MCGWVEGLGVWLGGEAGCVVGDEVGCVAGWRGWVCSWVVRLGVCAGWRGWGVKGVHPRLRKASAAAETVHGSRRSQDFQANYLLISV